MRSGFVISGVSHLVLVALALLGTPKLFDNPPLGAIEIELVRPEEVERPKEKPPEQKPEGKPKDKPASFAPSRPQLSEPPPQAAAKEQPKPVPQPSQQARGPQVP